MIHGGENCGTFVVTRKRRDWPTVGNQADMTSSSIFQSLNIGMNTSIVTLSYPKPRF